MGGHWIALGIDNSHVANYVSHMATNNLGSVSPTRYLGRPDGRIGYDVRGDGPLVLLVPGMGELRSTYRFLAPVLVAAGYTAVTMDLRGHGDSDADFAHYGDLETAGDIEALLRELGRPAVIVGNSMAAGAAVIVDAEHPELVDGLILIGPFVRNPPSSAFVKAMFHVMMSPLWVANVWKSYMPTLYAGEKPVDFADYRTAVHDSLRRPAYGKAFSQTSRQTDHSPAETRLRDVTAPALVLMGSRDPDFKDPAGEAQWIGEALLAEVVMIPESGHYPHSQQPKLSADAVLRFLRIAAPHA